MFKCKSGCEAECCGCITLSKTLIKKNRFLVQRKYQKIETRVGLIYPLTSDMRCIFLGDHFDCVIYNNRPYVCKLYGTTKELPCPYIDPDGNKRTDADIIQTQYYIELYVKVKLLQSPSPQ